MMDWQALLRKYVEMCAAVAWDGYRRNGRGVVVVDFSMAVRNSKGEVIGLPMGYQALDDLLREKRSDHIVAQVSELVSRYDPEKESVVLAIAPTDEGCDAHGARMEQRPCHAPIEWSDCRCDAHATKMGPLPIEQFYQNHRAMFGDE